MYQETRKLDLLKRRGRAGAVEPVTLRCGEMGQRVSATITNDGEAFDLTGYTASFRARAADGNLVEIAARIDDAAQGVASFAVTQELTAEPGEVASAHFRIVKEGEVLTTDTLPVIVLPGA